MDSSAWPAPLAGQTILVAADEALISFDIEALLSEAGASVVTVEDQRQGLLAAIGDRLTAAVLGDKLGGDSIDPIRDCLARRSIPFLLTAVSGKHVAEGAAAPILTQPFDGRALIDDLVRLLVTGGDVLDLDDTTHIDLARRVQPRRTFTAFLSEPHLCLCPGVSRASVGIRRLQWSAHPGRTPGALASDDAGSQRPG